MNAPAPRISFHFVDDEVQDQPSNFTLPHLAAGWAPLLADVIRFPRLPAARFVVMAREWELPEDPTAPPVLHVHLATR